MNIKQFEAKLNKLQKSDNLISTLVSLFKSNAAFKEVMSSYLDEDEADKVFDKYKRRLEKAFSDVEIYSLENCKSIANEYKVLAPDESYKAAIDYWFAYFASDLSAAYGDFEPEFYDEIVQKAMAALSYADKDAEFFNDFNENFERLIKMTGCFGWGVQDDLKPVYERIWIKWDEAGLIKERDVE